MCGGSHRGVTVAVAVAVAAAPPRELRGGAEAYGECVCCLRVGLRPTHVSHLLAVMTYVTDQNSIFFFGTKPQD